MNTGRTSEAVFRRVDIRALHASRYSSSVAERATIKSWNDEALRHVVQKIAATGGEIGIGFWDVAV